MFTEYFIFHISVMLLSSDFRCFATTGTCISCRAGGCSLAPRHRRASVHLLPFPSFYSFSLIHWHGLCKGRGTSCSFLSACYQTLIWLWTMVNILPEVHLQFVVRLIPEALPTHCVSDFIYQARWQPGTSSKSTMKGELNSSRTQ